MNQMTDTELMITFQKGNTHAFELLFEKYRNPIFNFIYRMLNFDHDAAEDLMQEVFVKVCKGRDLYQPRAKFSTWLFAITRNHCLNFIKSKLYMQGQKTTSLNAPVRNDAQSTLQDLIPSSTSSTTEAESRDLGLLLDRAIVALPDGYKEVFLLHAIEGFTHQEVGNMLELNTATVRTHYHRARRMLRQTLDRILDKDGDQS